MDAKMTKMIKQSLFVFSLILCACKTEPPAPNPWSITHEPVATYAPIPTVIEPGLAYGEPCKPPCWWGLIPGQATRQEVEQALERVLASGWADDVGGEYIAYPASSEYCIGLWMDDDTLRGIMGRVGFDHSLGTLVEQFGAPEGVYGVSGNTQQCSSCDEWVLPKGAAYAFGSEAFLLYPSQGLWFGYWVPSTGVGCICSEMKVSSLHYFAPNSMQGMLDDYNAYMHPIPSPAVEPSNSVTEQDIVEWHGFGGGY